MILFTAHLLNANGRAGDKHLGSVLIGNDGSGDRDTGNYRVYYKEGNGSTVHEVTVKDWPRLERGAWQLLMAALQQLDRGGRLK